MAEQSRLGKAAVVFFGLVAAAFAGILARGLVPSTSAPAQSPASRAALSKIASTVNTTLPMMVDKETELMNVNALEGVLVYNYRFIAIDRTAIDLGRVISELKPTVSASACSTPDTRNGLLKRGVTMRYSYSDRDRNYIAAFDITESTCIQPQSGENP